MADLDLADFADVRLFDLEYVRISPLELVPVRRRRFQRDLTCQLEWPAVRISE